MKKTLLLAPLLFAACAAPPPVDLSRQAAAEIRTADSAMSAQATRDGFRKTLLLYADADVVKYEADMLPIIGKQALEAYYGKSESDTKAISWRPFKAEASTSGDLGYTLGYWKFAGADTTLHGSYYTIWKKQSDGSWKFVSDGGNATPEPPEN
ncbi:MAG: hypothetical protein H6574_11760 [Lewinellaceae bacterium]|nr:hypothetical protein [Saprospiraceae bacterium]MCB9331752.1 hypothetical protein [Lewinellaceae bacterium]